MVTPRRRYTFFIDPELEAGLKELKRRDGTPESEAVRRAIAEYLERRRVAVKSDRKREPPGTQRKR